MLKQRQCTVGNKRMELAKREDEIKPYFLSVDKVTPFGYFTFTRELKRNLFMNSKKSRKKAKIVRLKLSKEIVGIYSKLPNNFMVLV